MKSSYIIAGVLATASVAWVLSGQMGLGSETEGTAQPEVKKAPVDLSKADRIASVRILTKGAEPFVKHMTVRGRTEALRTVALKSETEGRIVELNAEKGQRIEKGQLLARLEIKDRAARLKEAEALKEQKAIEYNAAKRLSKKGFKSETKLAAAKAELEAAEAAVTQARIALSDTRIAAPFDGVLNDREVEMGDYVNEGDTIGTIVDLSTVLVVADVNEQQMPFIDIGDEAEVRLVTGQKARGKVRYIAAMANPDTRTFRVEVEVPNPDLVISDGVTAEMSLALSKVMAHEVSPGILTIADTGEVGVKAVDEKGVVQFLPAQILENGTNSLWLGNLPPKVNFIVVGQELVVEGQQVKAVDAESLKPADLNDSQTQDVNS